MVLFVFNPEHDLCLANGSPHFVPPQSALRFAASSSGLMKYIYGDGISVWDAVGLQSIQGQAPVVDRVIPWGWNAALKALLVKSGIPSHVLPDDEWIEGVRSLQHRTTVMPLQPQAWPANNVEEIEERLHYYGKVVMKAPWSGSGRGVRFVVGAMAENDRLWAEKVIKEQQCVVVEPYHEVLEDFAFEYYVGDTSLLPEPMRKTVSRISDVVSFIGYSLFRTQGGVYRSNRLWMDERIESHLSDRYCVGISGLVHQIGGWLDSTLTGRYQGPLGVDLFMDDAGVPHVCELNLRHTMGLVAHEMLRNNPSLEGTDMVVNAKGECSFSE